MVLSVFVQKLKDFFGIIVSLGVGLIAIKLAGLWWKEKDLPTHFGGKIYDEKFRNVEKVFRDNFNRWHEKEGAAFAVFHKGKLVVDLWGGYADKSANREWKDDTLSVMFSSTKAVLAVCMGMLMDRGLLDPDALVTKYWPEFGAHGKDNVTVGMLLSHQAGLAVIDSSISKDAVLDWRKMSKNFENQIPNWPPGSNSGYHVFTFGFLLEQLIRRVDPKQRSLGQFLKEEITDPYNIDVYLGLPPEKFHRVTRLVPHDFMDTLRACLDFRYLYKMYMYCRPPNDFLQRLIKNPEWLHMGEGRFTFNNPEFLFMEIGSANGVGSARGLAEIFSLLNQGKLVKNQEILEKISQPIFSSPGDLILHFPLDLGYGFMFFRSPEGKYIFGHPGFGGQNVKLDRNRDLSFAYLTNAMKPAMGELTGTFIRLQKATYESIALKFDINLSCGPNPAEPDDTPLHISVRFSEKKFVFNSFHKGEWGKEERHSNPYKAGDPIDIRIRAHDNKFEIVVDQKEMCDFNYRMPLNSIAHMVINGSINLMGVNWGGKYYPVPYQTSIDGGLHPGKRVYVTGVPDKKADKFAVNLITHSGDVALHVNPRFGEKAVIRNSCLAGEWGNEEREGKVPFEKDKLFDLVIANESYSFQVIVNGHQFCTFAHRTDANSISSLTVDGDIELQGIHVK